ncbi:hypothetical protein CWI42_070700 [Ordospora colligata]|uniref:Uncharacterized protein n=1 Tax=Ordospora colligata OC4 TaxID=1354746 RepID=A0A0B2UKG2_9MICR|nr:uncharacterized protein M896_070690 [Ordospora colligata OC4]KHN69500.1 hypothetical protein M896_070690 [Ordospora colligata OC4]TBU15244.1 hypothetical protein CWI41_070690 [Ordospora colligata]TBU15315.1 hypothetical protein CWI40_070690 [Ordospora colligata]TBU18498.1 hypothetical protein CWI42_070700 [Ordospora colligata]
MLRNQKGICEILKIFKVLKSINDVGNALDVITIEDVVNVMKEKDEFKSLVKNLLDQKEYRCVARILIHLDAEKADEAEKICNDMKDRLAEEASNLNFVESEERVNTMNEMKSITEGSELPDIKDMLDEFLFEYSHE